MKKLSTLFFVLFLSLAPIQSVSAAAFYATISGPTQITAGQQFTVTVGVANVTNMLGLSASFSYDSSKLTLVSSTGLNDFSLTLGTKLVVDRLTGKSGTFGVASIVFKAKTSFSLSTTAYVRIINAQYSNGTTDVDDLNTRQLTIKMVSDNSYLKTLTVSQGSLSFTKTTTDYVVIVENNISSIVLGATADYSKSTISGLGTKTLAIYSNIFNIVVTAENGSKRTYSINVQRKDSNGLASPPSTNNYLREIKFTGYEDFNGAFVKETLDYVLNVGNLVTTVEMIATPDDSKSIVEITQAPLVVGQNVFKIKVTAENGDIKTYTITINRSSDVPTVDEDEIIEALKTVTTPSIGLNMPSSWEISTEILSALKTSGKTLIVVMKLADQTLYEWLIDGSKLIDTTPIKVKITFGSEDQDKIDALTNYASGLVLNFEENLSLPENTILRINVTPTYQDGDKINLYYYDSKTNKMSLSEKDLLVSGGKVEIPLTHTSAYFLSQTQMKIPGILDYIFVLVSIIESFIIVLLLLRLGRSRKLKRALPEN
ncbi:MAG: hypothetical protein HGB31_06755 [Erysipelotrichaceae bacterium]|nr:hypothetical protein [Erysipelotrichaceae bacterium]